MNAKTVGWMSLCMLVCLIAGASFEHLRQAWLSPEPTPLLEEKQPAAVRPAPETQADGTIMAQAARETLLKRIAELEEALAVARKKAPVRMEGAQPPATANAEPSRRPSFSDRMEQLKKDNPQEYADAMKRREEMQTAMAQRKQARETFLSAIETQNMTDVQRENHEKLLASLDQINALTEQLSGLTDPAQARDIRQQIDETRDSLRDMYASERRYLLEEAAKAVGYEGSQTATFADYIQSVIDSTSSQGLYPHGFRTRR